MTFLLTLVIGCDNQAGARATAPQGRVNAVVAKPVTTEAPDDFCDVYHADPGKAADFSFPALDGDAPAGTKGWRWVNVWATWCKPCIEEMPRLAGWKDELAGKGLGDVTFVSADDSPEVVTKFRAEHPDAPPSIRLESPDVMQPWLNELGLSGQPSLPVHIFVDENQKARCIRMGGVTDGDRGAVESLVGG